jgi:hypothetical protein
MAKVRWFLASIALLLAFSAAPSAFASITFPPTIQSQLGLVSAPPCTLCHRNDDGGFGTIVTPFGRTMMNRYGVTAVNVASLKAALASDEADRLDSDGDGVSDIDELQAGMDPNVGASGEVAGPNVPLPETGCSFAEGSRAPEGALAFACVCLGLALMRRRSRRLRSLLRAAALGAPTFVALAGCSLDTRQLRYELGSGGQAGSAAQPPAHAGANGARAGAAPVGDAGAGGTEDEAGGAPSMPNGSAGAAQVPLVEGCPDLDGNGVGDCDETLLKNSDFKVDVADWNPDTDTTVTWDAANAAGDVASGSALVASTAPASSGAAGSTLRVVRQCLPVTGKQLLLAYANVLVDASQPAAGHAELDVYFFDVAACAGAYVTTFYTPQPLDASTYSWLTLKAGSVSGPNTKSALVTLALSVPLSAASFSARFDNVLVKIQTAP